MPLLRYRSGDRGRWAACRCGFPTPAIVVYGPLVAEAIAELEGANGSLELVVDHANHVDRLTLRVGAEPGRRLGTEAIAEKLFALYPEIKDDLRSQASELIIEEVENLRLGPKALRVRDLRR